MKKIWVSNLFVAAYVLFSLDKLKEGLVLWVIAIFLLLAILGEGVENAEDRS